MKAFFNWLSNLFKKKEIPVKVNIPTTVKVGEDKPLTKKVHIIVGHGANGDKGARLHDGTWEYDYNLKVAKALHEKFGIPYFLRAGRGIIGVALDALKDDPDLVIELHLNAYNGKAKGCEALILKGDKVSAEYGRSFSAAMHKRFGTVLRHSKGVKEIARGDRGGASLSTLAPANAAILVEPFFGDNKDDYIPIEEYIDFLSSWIVSV